MVSLNDLMILRHNPDKILLLFIRKTEDNPVFPVNPV